LSTVIKCQADPIVLMPIIDQWIQECNAEGFGLNVDTAKGVDDLRKMVLSDDADLLLLVVQDDVVGFMGLTIFESCLLYTSPSPRD